MPFKRTVMRFAHTSGHTHCCYTEDGQRIITCGNDGDVRIWNGIDDDDPTSQCVGEFIICILHYNNRLLASTDLNLVQAYTFPDMHRDGTEFRFSAPITCIRINKTFLAAGSEDMLIKVVPRDKSEEYFELIGHEGPILKMDISVENLLASSSGDGTIRIWNLNDRKEIHKIDEFDKIKTFSIANKFVSPSFEPKRGNYMAYIKAREIIIVDTVNWQIKNQLKDEKIHSDYSVCCYSPCGKFIAAGTTAGEISVWEIKFNRSINGDVKGTDTQCITSIEWNPSCNGEFAYADNTGQLGTVINCYFTESNGDYIYLNGEAEEDELQSEYANDIDNDDNNDVNFGDIKFDDDDEDEDNENCFSLEKLKNETLKGHDLLDVDGNRSNDGQSVADDGQPPMTSTVLQIKEYKMQSPFQPNETPKSLEHRYLAWNDVGIVRGHITDNENSIEVEFHDSQIHHDMHTNNLNNHTMASLSTTVLALACEAPSKLVCITFGATASREWSVNFTDCEEILAITASDKLIACATDLRLLRIFSVLGTQREIVSLPGPVVCLASYFDNILVVYHSSAPTKDDQNMSCMLIHAIGLSLKCRDIKLPLTPNSKLNWIGFTDKGSPVSYDSHGFIRIFNMKSNYWMPICDTNLHVKNISDNFFVIGVLEERQLVRAIICKGSLYPVTNPKPMVSELQLQIPLCDIESEKSQLEETLLRYANLKVNNPEKQMKEIAIKLFALACRAEMEARAKELIEMIGSVNLLPLAVKYASKLGRVHLAEKLSELLPQFEEKEKEREQNLNDIEMEAINLIQGSPMSATLLLAQKEKANSPLIAPMRIGNVRNPFKKTGTTKSSTENNHPAISQLTSKFVLRNNSQTLFDESQNTEDILNSTPNMIATIDSTLDVTNSVENLKNDDQGSRENKPPHVPFVTWFGQTKDDIMKEYPDASLQELSKIAMRKYKQIFPSTNALKRKLNDEDDEGRKETSSTVPKLTKFGYNKKQ